MLQAVKAKGAVAFSFSMLWSFNPSSYTAQLCDAAGYNAPDGLLIVAASGDGGYPSFDNDWFPALCQGTLAIGGTTLTRAANSRGWTETVWQGTPPYSGPGSGCSAVEPKPAWQNDPSCSMRTMNDLSAFADFQNPGVTIFNTAPDGSSTWVVTGGTSAAAPLVAGALTALGIANGNFSPEWVWKNSANFYDVTSGSNGTCAGYICNAQKGYDGPTGWGTPNGALLATALPPGATGGTCATPSGSYSATCSGCSGGVRTSGCTLTCQSCTKIDGSENPGPTLSLPCNGDISNNDGTLVCISSPAVDAGSSDGGSMAPDGGGMLVDGGGGFDLSGRVGPSPADSGASMSGGDHVPPPLPSSHGGCSYAGASDAAPRAVILLVLPLLCLRRRRRRKRLPV
jgi:hypothetical protein